MSTPGAPGTGQVLLVLQAGSPHGHRDRLEPEALAFVGFADHGHDGLREHEQALERWLQPVNPSNIDARLESLASLMDRAPNYPNSLEGFSKTTETRSDRPDSSLPYPYCTVRGVARKNPRGKEADVKAKRRWFREENEFRSSWAKYMRDHPERAKFYQSGPWKIARDEQIRIEPNCQAPGCGEPATHVDHRVPIAEGGAKLDPANLQSLCKRHHGPKTKAESHRGAKRAAQKRRRQP